MGFAEPQPNLRFSLTEQYCIVNSCSIHKVCENATKTNQLFIVITNIWRECQEKFGYEGEFLFGKFTIADAMFAPIVLRFVTYDVQLDAVARKYVETILALPAIQEWINAAKQETEIIAQYEF